MDEDEESEEQESFEKTIRKVVVEINGVNCTILYPGETLSSVALKYDMSLEDLLSFNETESKDDIHEGDIVFLEKKKKKFEGPWDVHTVKKGESLYYISQKYGIRLANLCKMNHKSIFTSLREGEEILLK